MHKIGIIGGGASGVLVALHCWRKFQKNCEIFIFEPSSQLGRGKAYSTESTNYLLNTPVQQMSLFQDNCDDFENWLSQKNSQLIHSTHWPFVPRFYFAQYLQENLSKIPTQNFKHITKSVKNVHIKNKHYCLTTQNSQKYLIDYLVVATGFAKTDSVLPFQTTIKMNSKIHKSEDLKNLKCSNFHGQVVIIGTGLTAIDVWRQLRQNQSLKFILLSRHGFLPLVQQTPCTNIRLPCLSGMSPLQIFQVIRTVQSSSGCNWSELGNKLQFQAQKIWTCWTQKEKKTFLKYLKPYWEVIRHQLPDPVARELQKDIIEQNTSICAGNIQSISETETEIKIKYQERRTKKHIILSCQNLIFAMGPKIENTLINKRDIPGIQYCPFNFGYINGVAPRLWFVGPAAKGTYFEITSIPYIRTQAEMVAKRIGESIKSKRMLKFENFYVHPDAVGESYFEHGKKSLFFSKQFLKMSYFAFIHALFPWLYTDTPSTYTRDLATVLTNRRQRTTNRL